MAFNSMNLFGGHAEPSADRCRGGKIQLDLRIPKKTYPLRGSCGGIVSTSEMFVRIIIDMEKLPLVNTAGYTIGEEQIAPDEMPYDENYKPNDEDHKPANDNYRKSEKDHTFVPE